MVHFAIVLDLRTPLKNKKYPLKLRVTEGKKVRFISLSTTYTKDEHEQIFNKTPQGKLLEHRERANLILSKALKINDTLNPFSFERFKGLLFQKELEEKPRSIFVEDMFNEFMEKSRCRNGPKTYTGYGTARNNFLVFRPHLMCTDVNQDFLYEYEAWMYKRAGNKLTSTVSMYLRNLRCIINYAIQNDYLPKDYIYPFRKHIYIIPTITKSKVALSTKEVESVFTFNEFENEQQEFARDLWQMSLYCNGINFIDLIKLRRDNQIGNFFVIRRTKTIGTTRSNPKLIRIPVVPKLAKLIEKIGDKSSPFVLGLIKNGSTETQIEDKKKYVAERVNKNLQWLSEKLNLSVPLRLKTARDSFATTLKRSGVSREIISEKMGHSNILVTSHYLDSFEDEEMFTVNELLP